MKVWIAKGWWNYKGYTILGVFDSKEKALFECQSQADEFDYTEITDYEVE